MLLALQRGGLFDFVLRRCRLFVGCRALLVNALLGAVAFGILLLGVRAHWHCLLRWPRVWGGGMSVCVCVCVSVLGTLRVATTAPVSALESRASPR